MKEDTLQIHYAAINTVIEYINRHLFDDLTVKSLSGIANLSEFHFHRIFKSIVSEPIGKYIVRLRLEHVAQTLQTTSYNLTQIADQTSYQSKHALSKEFKRRFGVNPSTFRAEKQSLLKQYQPDVQLQPRIECVADKTIVFIRIINEYGEENSYRAAWAKLGAFGKANELLDENTEWLGISFDNPSLSGTRCRFYACFTVNCDITAKGEFGTRSIKGGRYAVFALKGSYSSLNNIYTNIYYHWLPNSNYKLREGIWFEKYINNPDKVSESDIITEIYIPVNQC